MAYQKLHNSHRTGSPLLQCKVHVSRDGVHERTWRKLVSVTFTKHLTLGQIKKNANRGPDADRSVGFINSELLIRRSKQYTGITASSTQVKCAAHDIIDNTVTGSFKGYSKVAKKNCASNCGI